MAGAPPPLERLFSHPEPVCGVYRPEEYARLFGAAPGAGPSSVALVPARSNAAGGLNATLAIGAADPQRFAQNRGSTFLVFLGEMMLRTLQRLRIGTAAQ